MSDDRVHFAPEPSFRAEVAAILERIIPLVRALLPAAEVAHVGGTSIPGAMTKGDIDLLINVPHDTVDASLLVLQIGFPDATASASVEGMLLKVPGSALPLDLLITERGAEDPAARGRARLLSDPDALAALNRLKQRFNGKPMASYRRAKDVFFQQLLSARSP